MAHGAPDASNVVRQDPIYGVVDRGELAVRQMNPHSIDRLGDVLFVDDFSRGLGHWELTLNGANSAISTTGGTAYTRGLSAHHWAFGDGVSGTLMEHTWVWETWGKLGAEIWIAGGYYADTVTINFEAGNPDGVGVYRLRIQAHAGGLEWQDDALAWHTLDPDPLGWGSKWLFVPLKVVVDAANGQWDRVIWAGQDFDLTGENASQFFGGFAWLNSFEIGMNAIAAGGGWDANLFLDNAIITQNEP